jgi:LPXTG-site transpeptidase (sortase) family protein
MNDRTSLNGPSAAARRVLRAVPFGVLALLLLAAGSLRHASTIAVSQQQLSSAASSASLPSVVAQPKRLIVPRLQIDVPLESVGITPDGEMAVPKDAAIPGWYKGGVRPGERGNAVIAGHKDTFLGTAGVFLKLGTLQPGDEVETEDLTGNVFRYRVTVVHEYDAEHSPMDQIFGPNTKATLQLITCSGSWSAKRRSYEKRTVVFTELIP